MGSEKERRSRFEFVDLNFRMDRVSRIRRGFRGKAQGCEARAIQGVEVEVGAANLLGFQSHEQDEETKAEGDALRPLFPLLVSPIREFRVIRGLIWDDHRHGTQNNRGGARPC